MTDPTPQPRSITTADGISEQTDALLARLLTLHPKSIDLSLGRIERLLADLGHPERKLPPVVHVAGTNGKGSVVAFLRAFAEAAGLRCHVYTSPHLVRFNERIRVAGTEISDADLNAVLEECERANAGRPITFFEITTAAAFLAFSRVEADLCILETGLGGRLDATNVIEKPALTCLTPVSLDHQHFLGDTLEDILREKAGILRDGVSCVAAQQGSKKIDKLLGELCKDAGAPLLKEGELWFARVAGGRRGEPKMVYKGLEGERTFPMPRLAGRHQVRNAALAMACAEALAPRFDFFDTAVKLGLNTVDWPGRMQRLVTGPLADIAADDGWELWLDGGHNKAAAEALAQHARTWRDKDLWLIYGSLNVRDPLAFLKPFEGKVKGLAGVAIPGQDNTLTTAEIAAVGESLHMETIQAEDVEDAVRRLHARGGDEGRILIAGSLYLAGHVLRSNG